MSELAFDANGEPITFPAEGEELRVRRFRNPGMRGACEVVHDRDGAPLYVPVDTSYVEFRALVDAVPGRYRLDPVDAGRRVIANTMPAYVTISEPTRNAFASGLTDDRESVIRELARANAEMTRTIADRFAGVMQAAAELLRAADGAGLPRREPIAPVKVEPSENDDGEDDDDDVDASPDIASLISQVLPMIQMWLAARTAEKTAAATPAAASPSAPEPLPASAPVASADAAAGEADVAAGRERDRFRTADEIGPGGVHSGTVPPSAPGAPPRPGSPTTPEPGGGGGGVRNAAPVWSPGGMDHLLAIYGGLSADEKRIAQLVVTRMTPEMRAQWLGELSAMSAEQAVELVRSMIPRAQRRKETDA